MDNLSVFNELKSNPDKYIPLSLDDILGLEQRKQNGENIFLTAVFLRHNVAISAKFYKQLKNFNDEYTISLHTPDRETLSYFPELTKFSPHNGLLYINTHKIVDATTAPDAVREGKEIAIFEHGDVMGKRMEYLKFFNFAQDQPEAVDFPAVFDPEGYPVRDILHMVGKERVDENEIKDHKYPVAIFADGRPHHPEIYQPLSLADLHELSQYRGIPGEIGKKDSDQAKPDPKKKSKGGKKTRKLTKKTSSVHGGHRRNRSHRCRRCHVYTRKHVRQVT